MVVELEVTVLAQSPVVLTVAVKPPPVVPLAGRLLIDGVVGVAWPTVRVNDWVASGLVPLWAGVGEGEVRRGPAAGVPARVAVPLPLSTKVTPLGRAAPPSDRVSVGPPGVPVAVTVKLPATQIGRAHG